MRKLPTDAKSNPSGKQNLFILEQHHLPAVKKLLESENLHLLTEETMSDLATELHELIIDTGTDALPSSDDINPNGSGQLSFKPNMTGTFTYHCAYHPFTMKGTIQVVAGS